MSFIKVKQINGEHVLPIPPIGGHDPRPILGESIIPYVSANIFLVSKKHSGKTSALFKILQKCTGKKTTIIAFVATLYSDDSWKQIRKWCDENDINFIGYTSMKEEEEDHLAMLVKHLQAEAEEAEQKQTETGIPQEVIKINTGTLEEIEGKPKERKDRYQAPEYIIVFDDLSRELKSPHLISLLKLHRHFKMKCIISTQYLNDLKPESRKQGDIAIIFRGFGEEKLLELYKDIDQPISFGLFEKLYHDATKQPYSFFYINIRKSQYRRNFTHIYQLHGAE